MSRTLTPSSFRKRMDCSGAGHQTMQGMTGTALRGQQGRAKVMCWVEFFFWVRGACRTFWKAVDHGAGKGAGAGR